MDEQAHYRVVILSLGQDRLSRWRAVQALASLLRISSDEAMERLECLPCILRDRLSQDMAEKYCRVISRLGPCCEVQSSALPLPSTQRQYW